MSTLANLNLYKNMMSGSELMDFWVRSGIHSEDWVKTNFSDRGYTNNTEWYRYFMNLVTPQYQNDVTIEGGGRNVAYMVSASQYHQEGFTPPGMCAAYDIYDAGGTVTGSFAPSEMQANVGLGWRFTPWLSLGANVRYLSNTLSEGHSYGAVSSDIFVMSRISDFSLALFSVQACWPSPPLSRSRISEVIFS